MKRVMVLLLLVGCPQKPELTPEPVADAGDDRHVFVGETVEFEAVESNGNRFVWTFGDGDADEGRLVEHVYAQPGHYTVYLEAINADGMAVTDSASVLVTHEQADPLPRHAATVMGDDERVYVVMPDFDQVALIDRASRTVTEHIDVCDEPVTLSVADDTLAVACKASDQIAIFDVGDTITSLDTVTLPWGSRPFSVVVAADGLVTAALQGKGAVVDLGGTVEIVEVGPDLRGLAVLGDGRRIASRHRSPDEEGEVFLFLGDWQQHGLALDPGPDSDTNARGLPSYLQQVVVRPDGRVAVFPGIKANIERGEYREGEALTAETTARATVRQIALHEDEGDIGSELLYPDIDNRDLASAAAFSPYGGTLYVAYLGAQVVDAFDAYTMQRVGGFQGVGEGLDGLWVTPDGAEIWVSAGFSRELVVFSLDDPAVQTELARIDVRGGTAEVLSDELYLGQQLFYGSIDPRMSLDGYMSCGSCHLDGDHDQRTWDFTDRGEGLRNTISLLGRRGTGHGPIHWSANFDEVQDFENDIRNAMEGEGFLSEEDWKECSDTLGEPKAGRSEDLDALAAFVESLDTFPRSPYRAEDGSQTADALAGASIFQIAGCETCHPPPEFTDSAWVDDEPVLHDVGTLGDGSGSRLGEELTGLDTPTLRGLHDSAPYLHDGSAQTVREVLVDRNDGRHGVTSTLSEVEIQQLIEFLLQLE